MYEWDVHDLARNSVRPRDAVVDATRRDEEGAVKGRTVRNERDGRKSRALRDDPFGECKDVEVWSAACPRSHLWALNADGTIVPPDGFRWLGDPLYFSECLYRCDAWGKLQLEGD